MKIKYLKEVVLETITYLQKFFYKNNQYLKQNLMELITQT